MTRISNQWVINSFMRALNNNLTGLNKAQVQVSSGKQIQIASDNPVNNALAMQHKTELTEHTQYIKNISRTTEWLDSTDTTLTSLEAAIQRARELAVQGANDTLVQTDRDAIAKEIDQLLQHVIDLGNTDVGGEFIFGGNDVKTKPFAGINGQNPYTMTDVVTYSLGDSRNKLNANSILDVRYNGDGNKLITEIEKGVLLEKNVTGTELFYRGNPIVPQPGFANRSIPLSPLLQLSNFNNGNGVQPGSIVLKDSNGIETWVDLSFARRVEDVLFAINSTNSFEASIDEVPSDSAVGLGIATHVGNANRIVGQPMLFLGNPGTDFDPSVATLDQLGIKPGFLNFNTRDGTNRRVSLQSTSTLQQLIDDINALDGGNAVKAEFEPILNRLILTDKTSGAGEFSVESRKNELKIRDLPAHTAQDLGINQTATAANPTQIVARYQILSEGAAAGSFNGLSNLNNTFSGFLSLFQDVNGNNVIQSPAHPEIPDGATPLSALNGSGVSGNTILITGRDGTKSLVNLNGATTINDAISAINTQTAGRQTASFAGGVFQVVDNTVGTDHFTIQPAVPPEAIPLTKVNEGQGMEKGFLRITTRDGAVHTVDLTQAQTLDQVIAAINANPSLYAEFNSTAKRLVINDNSVGPAVTSFKIEELNGNQNVGVREPTQVASALGLLKTELSGKTIFGDTLALTNDNGVNTLLSDVMFNGVPGSFTPGVMNLRTPDGAAVEVNLAGHTIEKIVNGVKQEIPVPAAQTVQDVIDRINTTGQFEASWDPTRDRFIIKDISGKSGEKGFVIEEQTNTARDLGFVYGTSLYRSDATNASPKDVIVSSPAAVKSLPTLIGSIDLNPAVDGTTELSSLNGGKGIQLGKIRINDKAWRRDQPGHSATIDLRGAKTIQDVLDRINNPGNGLYVEARINKLGNGIELVDKNHGATGRLEIIDVDSTSAVGLGFPLGKNQTVDNVLGGKDLDPTISEDTLISRLRINEGGVPLGKVYIQSGEFSGEIDLSACKTVGDIMRTFSTTDSRFNLTAWIDPDGKRLNLTNTKGQSYIKVRDLGKTEEAAASGLGFGGSRSIFETLQDLRDSLLRNDGTAVSEQSIKLLDEDLSRVLENHAWVGARTNRTEAAQQKQENLNLHINKLLDVVENVDMTEAITKMTLLETAFRAALQTGSRVMQTTLMDFLK